MNSEKIQPIVRTKPNLDELAREAAERTPCVRSGYCCKQRPCEYGEIKSPTDLSCRFLEKDGEVAPGVPVYRCGKYEWIMQNVPERDWRMTPAFGGGCSSPMFNTDRNRVIEALNGAPNRHPDRPVHR